MDRRSWLWKRKSSEKSPGETESSGSVSSHSERYSDDQESSKAASNHIQSPEVPSNVVCGEDNDAIKNLTEKLSSALLNIRAKEDLVKQHAKVAEEAVSGWEKAEKEVVSLRQQLETAVLKNSTLEDRISQLDEALKECVRQLRQSREQQEQRFQDALVKKTHEWESEKFELESQLVELEAQLEAAKEVPASISHDLQIKLEVLAKENAILSSELLAQCKELNIRTVERDLSNHAAETASKQHLESIKKVTKLEAECRRLQAMARRSSSSDHKQSPGDGLPHPRERLLAADNVSVCSGARASALIAKLDQFKSGEAVALRPTATSAEIDLMDDFLEMEKLVALPESNHEGSSTESQVDPSTAAARNNSLEAELEALLERTSQLENTNNRTEAKNAQMERLLAQAQGHLERTRKQLEDAESRLADLRRQLQFADDSKQIAEIAAETADAQRKLLVSQLESADLKVQELREKAAFLEGKIDEEMGSSAELARKCQSLEDEVSKRKQEAECRRAMIANGALKIKQEKGLAVAAGKLVECQNTIASLGQQLKSLATLDALMFEGEEPELNGGSTASTSEKSRKTGLGDTSSESPSCFSAFMNRKELYSPPPSSSSGSSLQDVRNLSLKLGTTVI